MASPASTTYIWPLTIALIVAIPLISLFRIRQRRGLREVPGPFFASIFSFDRILTTFSGHQFKRHLQYHEKYGNLVRIGPNHVSLGDSEQICHVYNITSKFDKVSRVSFSQGVRARLIEFFFRASSTPCLTQSRPWVPFQLSFP